MQFRKPMKTTLFAILLFVNTVAFGQAKSQDKNFSSSSKTLMLSYDDFGPQVLAHEFIGFQWWQWDAHGDADPKTKYDIRVIVFKGISLETVKNQYPINQKLKIDFRYASYAKSIQYLDKIINQPEGGLDTQKYTALRSKIVKYFQAKK
ncbi:hypothetical protein BKI52_39850 [marine bacterium AO1-C]|nr:hypothetical protein BKI52_39850 [marine bacterium AO1-C]